MFIILLDSILLITEKSKNVKKNTLFSPLHGITLNRVHVFGLWILRELIVISSTYCDFVQRVSAFCHLSAFVDVEVWTFQISLLQLCRPKIVVTIIRSISAYEISLWTVIGWPTKGAKAFNIGHINKRNNTTHELRWEHSFTIFSQMKGE